MNVNDGLSLLWLYTQHKMKVLGYKAGLSILYCPHNLTLLSASEGLTVEREDALVSFVLCCADKRTLIHHDKPCDL